MSASLAYNPHCDSLLRVALDSIIKNDSLKRINDSIMAVNDSLHRVISDNITIETLIKSQDFYSSSFNSLLWLVGIIITLGCAVFGGLGTLNLWKAKKYNEEMENSKKTFSEGINKQQKVIKEIIVLLPTLAESSFANKDKATYFVYLNAYFSITAKDIIELNDEDLYILDRFILYIEDYESKLGSSFFAAFSNFLSYCEILEDKRYYKKAKEAMSKLSEKNLI